MPLWFRISNSRVWFGLAAALMGLPSIGCDSVRLAPPPPPELRAAERGNSPGLVSGSTPTNPNLLGVRGVGREKYRSDTEPRPGSQRARCGGQLGEGPGRLRQGSNPPPDPGGGSRLRKLGKARLHAQESAALIREALARQPRPQVVIVEPANPADKDLALAIQEARTAKVPVVLVGRPLSGGADSPGAATGPVPILVTPPPFIVSARHLVTASIRNAKNAKLKPEGGAVFLINTAGDALLPDRIAAVRDALKEAGVTSIQEIRFAQESQVAGKLLTERLKADTEAVAGVLIRFRQHHGEQLRSQ